VMGDPSEGAGSDQGEKADLPTFSRPEYT
jgi:hypothetical protein